MIFAIFAFSKSSISYVTQNGNGLKNGTSWNNAYSSAQLQKAINLQGIVWVAKGVYLPSKNDKKASFVLKDGARLYGGFKGNETKLNQRNIKKNLTILSGDITNNDIKTDGITKSFSNIKSPNSKSVVRIVNLKSKSTTIDGFTITGGDGGIKNGKLFVGGGIYIYNSSPTINNVTFIGNKANMGAGIGIHTNSNPKITNTTFIENKAGGGGGIGVEANSNPKIINANFSNNKADGGGAILIGENSSLEISNANFSNNQAVFGGAIYMFESSPIISNATFYKNKATIGSCIEIANSSPKIINSTFTNNLSTALHREVINSNSPLSITNSTFTQNNTEEGWAISISLEKESKKIPTLTIKDSIIYANPKDNGIIYRNNKSNFNISNSIIEQPKYSDKSKNVSHTNPNLSITHKTINGVKHIFYEVTNKKIKNKIGSSPFIAKN